MEEVRNNQDSCWYNVTHNKCRIYSENPPLRGHHLTIFGNNYLNINFNININTQRDPCSLLQGTNRMQCLGLSPDDYINYLLLHKKKKWLMISKKEKGKDDQLIRSVLLWLPQKNRPWSGWWIWKSTIGARYVVKINLRLIVIHCLNTGCHRNTILCALGLEGYCLHQCFLSCPLYPSSTTVPLFPGRVLYYTSFHAWKALFVLDLNINGVEFSCILSHWGKTLLLA